MTLPGISKSTPLTQPPLSPNNSYSLTDITKKVSDVVLSRWGLVAAAGLATAMAMGAAWGALATGVLALAAWCFYPVSSVDPTVITAAQKAVGEFLFITANVLGIFSDPFEFEGDYGDFINGVKAKVEERLIGKSMMTDKPTKEDYRADINYGPTLEQLCPGALLDNLRSICRKNGLDVGKLNLAIAKFFPEHQNGKPFNFFRNCPPSLLSIDLSLRLKAKNQQEPFSLPIVNSSVEIKGSNSFENKLNLAEEIFTGANATEIKDIYVKLQTEFGNNYQDYTIGTNLVSKETLDNFATPEGQLLFYYLYQIMNIHLVADIMPEVNQAKREFAQTIGNAERRAEIAAKQFADAGGDVIFTQECDRYLPIEMEKQGYFSTERLTNGLRQQSLRSIDGSVIFLKKTRFKENFISEPYELSDQKHKATTIIAEEKDTVVPIVLASCHGDAKVAADARNQIYRVHKVYEKCLARNPKAKMAIGIDANPKDEREMTALERVVEGLHLIMSKVGATTIKKRKVTPQHEKTNKLDNHPKDAIIVSPGFKIIRQTVGYAPSLPPETRLPNKVIVSDHAPVGMHVTSADAGG